MWRIFNAASDQKRSDFSDKDDHRNDDIYDSMAFSFIRNDHDENKDNHDAKNHDGACPVHAGALLRLASLRRGLRGFRRRIVLICIRICVIVCVGSVITFCSRARARLP